MNGPDYTNSQPPGSHEPFPRLDDDLSPKPRRRRFEILPFAITAAGILWIAVFVWISGVRIDRDGRTFFTASWGDQPACLNPVSAACQDVNAAADAKYRDADACVQPRPIVCLVPVGGTTPEMIGAISERLKNSTPVAVLPPLRLSDEQLNPERNQYNARAVIRLATEAYAASLKDSRGVLIVLTPADIYLPTQQQWRYAFGTHGPSDNDRLSVGIVSTLRMSLADFWLQLNLPLGGELHIEIWPSSEKVESRAYRMVLKYAGLGYYGLPLSSDPRSVMYNNILSVTDLDHMDDELPASGLR